MNELEYEYFVRNAFGYSLKTEIDRSGDPARCGDADNFHNEQLSSVIAGASYSMSIYISDIINSCNNTEEEDERINTFLNRVIACRNVQEVGDVLDDFNRNVFSRYYTQSEGKISLNSPS